MLVVGTFNWSMECSWIAPLTPTVMVIRGFPYRDTTSQIYFKANVNL
jgi:hypothetical protein